MNKLFKYAVALAVTAILIPAVPAKADEGMWMVHAINKALEKNMRQRGLKLKANQIYDADAPGATLADAVVSMAFGCTGSIISPEGLLITNHHCAYGDVYDLSMGKFGNAAEKKNYLEEGFWAMRSDEEVSVPGKKVYFLKEVMDVTDIVKKRQEEAKMEGKPLGMRKLSYQMEQEYSKDGLEAMLYSMWSGSVYYIVLYKVYSDVRLVAAPPVSISAYGGDIDNWEWPQHKCDFAMYRIYTAPDGSPAEFSPENVPLKPENRLKISLEGYKAGDFTMVIGYPGRTNRYSSTSETDFSTRVELPISNALRGEQMEIIKRWMDADPQIRLKYADYYFSLSNVQELFSGQVQCVNRFDVVEDKKALEKELQEWILADGQRKEKWGNLLADMQKAYSATEAPEKDLTYYRETLIRGTRISRVIYKINAFRNEVLLMNGIKPKKKIELINGPDPVEENCCETALFVADSLGKLKDNLLKEYEGIDLKVEKDLFIYAVKTYLENVNPQLMGEFQKELHNSSDDYASLAADLWENSFLTDSSRLSDFLSQEHTMNEYFNDPVVRLFRDSEITVFNKAIEKAEGDVRILELKKEFTHALYRMRLDKGVVQYPDANSTMRLTYGTIGGIEPRDGIICDWKTTPSGILEKYNPSDYDFSLSDRQYLLYRKGDWGKWGFGEDGKGMYVNFLTDCDITGGNSGSPVLNAKGELIGLAFDGNKESLASDVYYTPGYNKCVCVDIRFVLWTLDRYAGMTRIIEELGL